MKQTSIRVVEPDDAGVVAEDAHQPVACQLARRAEDRLLEQVVDRPPLEGDPPFKRLVRAVLAPGLGERLQLAVGRVPAEPGEVVADGLHLGETQRELARPAQRDQRRVIEPADRHLLPAEVVGLTLAEAIERKRADDGLLDGVVGQHPLDQAGQFLGGPIDPVGPDRPDVRHGVTQVLQERQGALGLGVGHAGLRQDIHHRGRSVARRSDRADRDGLDDRIAQDLARGSPRVLLRDGSLHEEAPAGPDRPGTGETELGGLRSPADRRRDPSAPRPVQSRYARAWTLTRVRGQWSVETKVRSWPIGGRSPRACTRPLAGAESVER